MQHNIGLRPAGGHEVRGEHRAEGGGRAGRQPRGRVHPPLQAGDDGRVRQRPRGPEHLEGHRLLEAVPGQLPRRRGHGHCGLRREPHRRPPGHWRRRGVLQPVQQVDPDPVRQRLRQGARPVGLGGLALLLLQPAGGGRPELQRGPRGAHQVRAGGPQHVPGDQQLRVRQRRGPAAVPAGHQVRGDLLLPRRRGQQVPLRAGVLAADDVEVPRAIAAACPGEVAPDPAAGAPPAAGRVEGDMVRRREGPGGQGGLVAGARPQGAGRSRARLAGWGLAQVGR
mmetsp:Transcript_94668/g.267991  ORF Transcript_94668/g.267991 Transcript_94668/m.267991 type:complete len:281 (+) Transcript_94668:387-1229(+)